MIKHNIVALVYLILFSQNSFAGSVTTSPASIEVKVLPNGHFSFQFCEMDVCKPFGNPKGYDAIAIDNMNNSCKQKRRIDPIVSSVLSGLSFSALSLLSSGTGTVVFISGQMLSKKIDSSINVNAVKSANDLMVHLTKNESDFLLPFNDFVLLKTGLEYCHNLYETTPYIWLQDCERSFQCKKKLTEKLFFTDAQINQHSAFDLFLIKKEVEDIESF